MLLAKGKVSQEMCAMLSNWRHSGFNVYCGNRISPSDETAMENLAHCIIRASFSQESRQYLNHEETLVYTVKDGKSKTSQYCGSNGNLYFHFKSKNINL